jgi:hypothetical protein
MGTNRNPEYGFQVILKFEGTRIYWKVRNFNTQFSMKLNSLKIQTPKQPLPA